MHSEIYLIKLIGSGSLSAMAKPSTKGDVNAEFKGIAAKGITRVVSLLALDEADAQGLEDEQGLVQRFGMEFDHFPIGDFGVPADLPEFIEFIHAQYRDIVAGKHVVVHCHAGIGRTGIVTSSLLLHCGYNAMEAIELVSEKRGVQVPDTQRQIDWICDHQKTIAAGANDNSC